MPSPKNTLTELEPVTLPTALSALSSLLMARIEAKVSGKDVPRATRKIPASNVFRKGGGSGNISRRRRRKEEEEEGEEEEGEEEEEEEAA